MPIVSSSAGDGQQGPPGLDKELQVTTRVGNIVAVPPGQSMESIAPCEPDEVATGGGLSTVPEGANVINPSVGDSGRPFAAPTTWGYFYLNPGPNTVTIQAFAECAKLVDVP